MDWKNKKVLVAGGAGLIGSHMARTLASRGAKVTVADNLSSGSLKNIADFKNKVEVKIVDLRTEKEFTNYTIPGSVNVPIENLLTSDLKRNQKILLFGNDDVSAAQAWFILKSSDYKGVYILNGGLNSWKNEILYPKRSANLTPEDSIKFEKIKQVSLHFGGSPQIQMPGSISNIEVTSAPTGVPNLPKVTIPAGTTKKKKEGC